VIITPVTIQGNGAVIERSNSAPSFRLFAVANQDETGTLLTTPGSLTLEQVTLRGGLAQGGRGGNNYSFGSAGGGGAGLGGAIFNQGALTIRQSTLYQNTAQGGAGGSIVVSEGYGGSGGGGPGGFGGSGGYFGGGGGGQAGAAANSAAARAAAEPHPAAAARARDGAPDSQARGLFNRRQLPPRASPASRRSLVAGAGCQVCLPGRKRH
jgi:hypothetical protein